MLSENIKVNLNIINSPYDAKMPDKVFDALREIIYKECGITLSENKRIMLSSRLYKRLRTLNLYSFKEYFKYLNSPTGKKFEFELMINEITTNKTEFFREPAHFDILVNKVLPDLGKINPDHFINIWSAGCSTGEEPYTLSMVLTEYSLSNHYDFSIVATDICTSALEKAKNGIYLDKDIVNIPHEMKYKYMMKGKDDKKGLYKIVPEIRNKIEFLKHNLKEKKFVLRKRMQVIFCRNVIIYFDHETQVELFKKFYDQLVPGGYMFIGHSETLSRVNKDFKFIAPSVYQKPN